MRAVVPHVADGGDSFVYLRQASYSLWSRGLLAGSRPPGVPLLYKILGGDPWLIAVVQCLFATVAWVTLAVVTAHSMRTPSLRLPAFATILVFGSAATIVGWEPVVMSESASFSALALLVAASIALSQRWSNWRFVAWLIVLAYWVATRDTNGYIAGILGIGFAVGALVQRSKSSRRLAIACLVLFLASYASSEVGNRWWFPFLNIIGHRVLPDAEAKGWFIEHGMPASAALDGRTGAWANSDGWAFYRAPELEEFRAWAREHGRSVYFRYLVTHPTIAFGEPLENWKSALVTEIGPLYRPPKLWTPMIDVVDSIAYPRQSSWLVVWMLTTIAVATVSWRRGGLDVRYLPGVVLLALVYPAICIVWHGDAMEVPRHGLQVGVQLRLGVWLLLLCSLDGLLEREGSALRQRPLDRPWRAK